MSKPLFVDLSNFIFRFVMKSGRPEVLAEQILNNLESFKESLLCDGIIIFLDYKGSDYRKSIYPDYKGNRQKKDTPFQKKMDAFFKKLPTIVKILNIHYPVIRFKGVEADDTMYFISKLYKKGVILSTDADLLQIGWPQFSYTKKKYINLDEQGFDSIKAFVEAKAIAGDTSDNIKGLERVGLKTVSKLFKKYHVDSYDALLYAIGGKPKGKIETRIVEGEPIIARNKKLVDIGYANDKIITEEIKNEIYDILDNYGCKYERAN